MPATKDSKSDYTIADAAFMTQGGTCSSLAPDTLSRRHLSYPAILLRSWSTCSRVEQQRLLLTDKNSLQEMDKAKLQGRGHTLSTKLTLARRAQLQAVQLANDVKILIQWLSHDILALAGPSWEERQELFDFIVAELSQRENLLAHRQSPLRTALKNQRDDLLAFAQVLDEKLLEIAQRFDTPEYLVRAGCLLHRKKPSSCAYWQRWNYLHHLLPGKFHLLMAAVSQAMQQTPRASSLVENLNSRLRNYFFLRRQLGSKYLDLLQFFLNHRAFMRSECPERVGKSPTQLMTGQPHAHWLELLGFERFQRA